MGGIGGAIAGGTGAFDAPTTAPVTDLSTAWTPPPPVEGPAIAPPPVANVPTAPPPSAAAASPSRL
jgi:hypothetical protein